MLFLCMWLTLFYAKTVPIVYVTYFVVLRIPMTVRYRGYKVVAALTQYHRNARLVLLGLMHHTGLKW